MQETPLKLLSKSLKQQAFQLPQKIFKHLPRNCQTMSWKVQLAALAQVWGDLTVLRLGVLNGPGEFPQITSSKLLN